MFDLFNMMGKVKEAQEKMKAAKDSLVNIVVTAEAGSGLLKATVNGNKQVLKIEIDPSLGNDLAKIEELTLSAVNKAIGEADLLAKDVLKKSMEGVLPNIPGLDLESFLNK